MIVLDIDDVLHAYDSEFVPLYSKYVSVFGDKDERILDRIHEVSGKVASRKYEEAISKIVAATQMCGDLLWRYYYGPIVKYIKRNSKPGNIHCEKCVEIRAASTPQKTKSIFDEIEKLMSDADFELLKFIAKRDNRKFLKKETLWHIVTIIIGIIATYGVSIVVG